MSPKSVAIFMLSLSFATALAPTSRFHGYRPRGQLSASESEPQSGRPSTDGDVPSDADFDWREWSVANAISAPKLSVRPPVDEERGKGGVHASEPIASLEVIARIPRNLVVAASDAPTRALEAAAGAEKFSWAADLTAATLAALHRESDDDVEESNDGSNERVAAADAKRRWIASWSDGGWGTNGSDLGPPEADWGAKCVTGSLLATGSDNDRNIYAKFRFPCHPVVHRAGRGLALLTGADEESCMKALLLRGKTYRGMRDALSDLVKHPTERKGSIRERRAWDVADVLSKVLSRAAFLHLDDGDDEDARNDASTCAVVPLHERLAHCDARGENAKLLTNGKDEVLLVATRDIEAGEAITRDYTAAPRLDGDESEGALRLLLQFGLPPNAWPKAE